MASGPYNPFLVSRTCIDANQTPNLIYRLLQPCCPCIPHPRFSSGRHGFNSVMPSYSCYAVDPRVKALFGDGGDGFRAMMRIVKLNSAIQNRSVRELLELITEECQYFFSNLPPVSVSQISQNMFLLLHEMMLRHQVSFVLKPTENGGFDLGIKWSLEWKGEKLPWDVDCTVSTTHVYTGLVLISQVNQACAPLLQRILQMIYQNLDAVILIVANKFLPEGKVEDKERSSIIVCAIIGLVAMVLFYAMFNNL